MDSLLAILSVILCLDRVSTISERHKRDILDKLQEPVGYTPCMTGFPNCNPVVQANVPGLIVGGHFPAVCTPIATAAYSGDDLLEYENGGNSYLAVDAANGQVYYSGGLNASAPMHPCAPLNTDGSPGRLVQTYEVQCIDSCGWVGPTTWFNVSWPPCEATQTCQMDGKCCMKVPILPQGDKPNEISPGSKIGQIEEKLAVFSS